MKSITNEIKMLALSTLAVASLGFAKTAHASGTVGLGLVGEDPSGLTLKLKLNSITAFDLRLGVGFRFDNAFLFQGNYLVNVLEFSRNSTFSLPLYIGIGGTMFVFNDNNGNQFIGLNGRVPIGLNLDLNNAPIDFFAEIAPQFAFVPGLAVGVDGAAGIRFFF
jgi:hypothetical protein